MKSLPVLSNTRSLSKTFSRALPKYFSADEVKMILSNSLREENYKAFFLCLFLWNTGTRISEALSVKVGYIDLMGKALRVSTLKREGHERIIPLQNGFIEEVALWINHNELKRGDLLFPFTRRTGLNLVRFACDLAGINDKRAHPHTFRHSFAINCILQGTPITVLQEWLGHRDITKTLIYTKVLAMDSRAFIENIRM